MPDPTKKMHVILDLDNCISHDAHRIPLINWALKGDARYEAYHSACYLDDFDWSQACKVITGEPLLSSTKLIIFTGRPNKFRHATERWLIDNLFKQQPSWGRGYILFMRNDGDERSSVEIKREMLMELFNPNTFALNRSQILVAVDDRPEIVEMYRKAGVNGQLAKLHDDCAYTAPGDAPKDIERAIAEATEKATRSKDGLGYARMADGRVIRAKEHRALRPDGNFNVDGSTWDCLSETQFDSAIAAQSFFEGKPAADPFYRGVELDQAWSEELITLNAADVLRSAAKTYEERNAVYKDNYKAVGLCMEALFPEGITLKGAADFDKWHLFELAVVKMTRFARTGLVHRDSIHDMAVYAAMVEALIPEEEKK